MDNAAYLGIYVAGRDVSGAAFPIFNRSGFWRAWEGADGRYLIQALDAGKNPWGEVYDVDPAVFQDILTRLPSEEDILAASSPVLRADAPDLLETWYTRMIASAADGDDPSVRHAEEGMTRDTFDPLEEPSLFYPDSLSEKQISACDFLEDGSELPPVSDELFLSQGADSVTFVPSARALEVYASAAAAEERGTVPPPAAPSAAAAFGVQGAAYTTTAPVCSMSLSAVAPNAAMPRPFSASPAFVPAPERPSQQEAGDGDDERALQIELRMRAEFAELTAHLDEVFQPMLEADLERFLRCGLGLTWKQKYMFSEFGMTLRRKHKPKLALQSHLQALALAPDDASILFNLARTEYELGNLGRSRAYLKKSLLFAPNFDAALKFLEFLQVQVNEDPTE